MVHVECIPCLRKPLKEVDFTVSPSIPPRGNIQSAEFSDSDEINTSEKTPLLQDWTRQTLKTHTKSQSMYINSCTYLSRIMVCRIVCLKRSNFILRIFKSTHSVLRLFMYFYIFSMNKREYFYNLCVKNVQKMDKLKSG